MLCTFGPVATRHGLDGHQADVLALDLVHEGLVVGPVRLVAPQHGVERREHRRERVSAQRLEVSCWGLMAVAGDADCPDHALLLRPDRGRECAVGPSRRIELSPVTDRVKLQQIDTVCLQPPQRSIDLPPSRFLVTMACLRRQEDPIADLWHPRSQPQLGFPIVRRHVEVVDAPIEGLLNGAVRHVLRHIAQGRSAVDENRTVMLETSEPSFLHIDHSLPVIQRQATPADVPVGQVTSDAQHESRLSAAV